jgi:hypothetical protein
MESSGVTPDTYSINTAVAACERLGDGDAALALLRYATGRYVCARC